MNIFVSALALLLSLSIFSCKKSNDNSSTGTTNTNPGGTNPAGTTGDTTTGVSTYAGNGSKGSLIKPDGICFDSQGNMYVTEISNSDVKKIDPSGNITLFTGQSSNPGCEGCNEHSHFRMEYGSRMIPYMLPIIFAVMLKRLI